MEGSAWGSSRKRTKKQEEKATRKGPESLERDKRRKEGACTLGGGGGRGEVRISIKN